MTDKVSTPRRRWMPRTWALALVSIWAFTPCSALSTPLIVPIEPKTVTSTPTSKPSGQRGPANAKTPAKGKPRASATPKVVPKQSGKIAVFAFRGDDRNLIQRRVAELFQSRGLRVMTGLRTVDSPGQFRDMAAMLDLAAYIEGDIRGNDKRARATIHVRSGQSGRRVAAMTLTERWNLLPGEITEHLWSKLGPALARACADSGKRRRRGKAPMRIDAGTPLDSTPTDTEGSREDEGV